MVHKKVHLKSDANNSHLIDSNLHQEGVDVRKGENCSNGENDRFCVNR